MKEKFQLYLPTDLHVVTPGAGPSQTPGDGVWSCKKQPNNQLCQVLLLHHFENIIEIDCQS